MFWIIIAVIAVLFLAVIAAGYLIFVSVLDQKHYKETPRSADFVPEDNPNGGMYPTASRLFLFQKPFIEAMKNMAFEELDIYSSDGLKLHGYLLRGNPKEVVILVHGYRSNKESDYADKLQIYQKRNSTILLVDDRAHRKSEGRYIGFSELDKYDVLKWIDKMNEMFDAPNIYLHGISMGGATVIHTADMKPQNVKGIIDDCGFDSIDNLTRSIIHQMFHIPFFPVGNIASLFSKWIAGIDFKASIGEKCVANTDIPIVFIHGKDDRFVPCIMTEKMYASCASPKRLLLVDGAGHAASFLLAQEEYTALVNDLLDGKINSFE